MKIFINFILTIAFFIFLTSCQDDKSNDAPKIIVISPEPGTEIDFNSEIIITFSEPVYPAEDQYGDALFYSYYGPITLIYDYKTIGSTFTSMAAVYDINSNTLKLKFNDEFITAPTKLGLEIEPGKIRDAEGATLDLSELTHESKLVYQYILAEE